jgi:glycosyltransferase involved in cell wall biosynthesis
LISVIVSSKDKLLLNKLSANLTEKTLNEYELIPVINENGQHSISQAYNLGVSKSKGNHLVFVHEDIVIHTKSWDEFISIYLRYNEVGIIGQAGAVYKSRKVCSWIDVPSGYYRTNAVAGWNSTKPLHINRKNEASLSEVTVLDGMFLAMRREVWEEFPFDRDLLTGFHGYDLDISLAIGSKYKLVVCHDILVEHLSGGNFGMSWYHESVKVHQKWKKALPRYVGTISSKELKNIEYHVLVKCIYRHLNLGTAGLFQYISLLWEAFSLRPLSPMNFRLVWQVIRRKIFK